MEPDSSQQVTSDGSHGRPPEATDEEVADIIAQHDESLERPRGSDRERVSEATDEEIAHLFEE